MNTTKMSLANIQGKLSRTVMKNIMAGSGVCNSSCSGWNSSTPSMQFGTCSTITTQVGNVRIDSCACSLSNGSSCNR